MTISRIVPAKREGVLVDFFEQRCGPDREEVATYPAPGAAISEGLAQLGDLVGEFQRARSGLNGKCLFFNLSGTRLVFSASISSVAAPNES